MIDKLYKKIEDIYYAIDSMYQMAARHYKFDCTGCLNNCCETRFYHYTVSEAFYLKIGFQGLPKQEQDHIIQRSLHYEKAYKEMNEEERLMCPLNVKGLCTLYKWRPMICRLHGLPYEVQDMNMSATFHGGCERFMSERATSSYTYMTINRTIFYREFSKIEEEARKILSLPAPTKKTVAKILLSME